jgi:hypothetical protein
MFIPKEDEVGVVCSTHRSDEKYIYKFLVGNIGGKERVERCRDKWEDNIKTDLKEIYWRM